MNHRKVIIVSNNRPLNNDARIRQKMTRAIHRAERLSSQFPDLDLLGIQKAVNKNLKKLFLSLNGRYMDLLDVMNFLRNHRKLPELTLENATEYYSLANNITLNGIYLYQYILQEGYDPHIIHNYATSNLAELLQEKPLAVCISSNFIFLDDIKQIVNEIKQHDPRIPVIVGGMGIRKLLDPGINLTKPSTKTFSSLRGKVDAFVIESLGEQTLIKVLKALEYGSELDKIPNIAFFDDDGKMRFTQPIKENLHIDLTAIAWNRIPSHYLRKVLPVTSSRGCYYRCRFCTFHRLFPKVEYKSLEVLKRELKLINDLEFVKHVRFTDDNFTASKARLKEVLKMMIREEFDFSWSCYARANALTAELIKMMRVAGCEFVYMGIESGSQTILDNMDKKLSREAALNAIKMVNDHGIYSRGSFILGYLGETRQTFLETIDLINESGLHYYMPYLFTYSRKSLVHEDRDRFGLRGIGHTWKQDTMDATEASHCMSEMIKMIPRGFNDGQTYVEEIYNLLLGSGYSSNEIFELFRLKRDLHLAAEKFGSTSPLSTEVERILSTMEAMIN